MNKWQLEMPTQADRMYFKKRIVAEKYFYGVCFVCGRRYGRGFTYHHLKYVFGEYTYRDFPDTVKYNLYILPIVEKHPERFLLLCKKHHTAVTRLKQYLKINLVRLLLAVWLTE